MTYTYTDLMTQVLTVFGSIAGVLIAAGQTIIIISKRLKKRP